LQPSKRENALRTLVEEALSPPAGKAPEAAAFANCMELGLLYLDGDRLDEAEKLFTRLEAVPQPPALPLLGQLGKGITLALRNQAKESNALFCKVFARDDGRLIGSSSKPKKAVLPPGLATLIKVHTAPVKPFLDHERGRHWLGQARKYNFDNGLPESQVPRYLLVTFRLDGEAKK
jgi:hypothetical protein